MLITKMLCSLNYYAFPERIKNIAKLTYKLSGLSCETLLRTNDM